MAKASLAELTRVLAARHNLSQRDTERFVSAFVDVANEALRYEKQLKIKGLGTFKVIDTKDRESVDVNSGERIVIEGRGKITFTPDTVMRDLVNKPFAQFQTVVLNDGVDFSDIDNESMTDEESHELPHTEEIERPLAPLAEVTEQPVAPLAEKIEQPVTPSVDKVKQPDDSSDQLIEERNQPEQIAQTEAPVEFVDIPETSIEQPILSITEEKQNKEADETHRAVIVDFAETPEQTMNVVEKNKKSYHRVLWTFVSLLLIAGGTLMGYFFGRNSSKNYVNSLEKEKITLLDSIARMRAQNSTSEALTAQENIRVAEAEEARLDSIREKQLAEQRVKEEARERARAEAATKARHDSLAKAYALSKAKAEKEARIRVEARMKAKQKEEAAKAAAANAAAQASKAVSVQSKKSSTTTTASSSKIAKQYDASNAQVRLGAYSIVGYDQTVTVRKGQTLASISKAFFGPGMECYVQAYNNGITEVKEGMKLKIPKLQLKKKSTTKK